MINAMTSLPWLHDHFIQSVSALKRFSGAQSILCLGDLDIGRFGFIEALSGWLLCEHPGDQMCGTCRSCHFFLNQVHPDFCCIGGVEPQGLVKIDSIRKMITVMQKTPAVSQRRVAVIHAANHLNQASNHALLKTLEEPEGTGIFILAADTFEDVLPTLRSRCRVIRLSAHFNSDRALDWLQLKAGINLEAARSYLVMADSLPLRALYYAQDSSIQVLMEHLLVWPVMSGHAWNEALKDCSLLDLIHLCQVLALDAIKAQQLECSSVWAAFHSNWMVWLSRSYRLNCLYHAVVHLKSLKQHVSSHVTLNHSAVLERLRYIWLDAWICEENAFD